MAFIEDEPPSMWPRGQKSSRPSRADCFAVEKFQSYGVLNSFGKAAGIRISGLRSRGPDSTSATRVAGSSESRAASTHPADPAPTMT